MMTETRSSSPIFEASTTMGEDLISSSIGTHHPDYYFEDGNLVLMVENTIFRVFRSTFTRHSSVFKDLFSLPEPAGHVAEGSGDNNPLFFSGISAVDFERFLWVIYPLSYGTHKAQTAQEWTSILNLSTRWEFADIRALAIRSVQALDISPVDRIILAREFDIPGRWAINAYTALCERAEPLSIAEANSLGLETVVRIVQMRERLRSAGRTGAGGYGSLTKAAAARRVVPGTKSQERLQWDVARSFLDQRDISPPCRPSPRKLRTKPASESTAMSGTARLVAEAFGLGIAHRRA